MSSPFVSSLAVYPYMIGFNEVESVLLRAVVGISTEMTLCECEKAQGAPNGLSCDKEGWFISSFEREGSWVRTTCLSA